MEFLKHYIICPALIAPNKWLCSHSPEWDKDLGLELCFKALREAAHHLIGGRLIAHRVIKEHWERKND